MENCAIEHFTWPVGEKLSYYRPRALRWEKNGVWGKQPLKVDLVEVGEKHIPEPGVHPGNNNSLNNNDHKNMAEW